MKAAESRFLEVVDYIVVTSIVIYIASISIMCVAAVISLVFEAFR